MTAALSAAVASLSATENPTSSIANSSAGPESQHSIGSASTIHWQSAFWALAAIALNTCLQESGQICGIKAKFGLLVKTSPVFCAVDTVIAWGQIIYYLRKNSPREALRIVASSRENHGTDELAESTSLPRVVGRCLLLVIALLQVLKLYALRGIPWTQAFGTIYILSYGTNALLNVLGRPRTTDYPTQSDMRRGDILPSASFIHCFAWVAACLQTAMWTVITSAAVPDQWLSSLASRSCRWPISVVIGVLFSPWLLLNFSGILIFLWALIIIDFVIMLLPSVVVLITIVVLINGYLPSLPAIAADVFGCSAQTMGCTLVVMLTLMAIFGQTCYFGFLPVTSALFEGDWILTSVDHIAENWDKWTSYGFAFLTLAVVAMISHFLYRALFMGSMARKLGISRYGMSSNLGWACLFIFLANVSLALLYYGHVYSPEGTWKPSWTENLGRKLV